MGHDQGSEIRRAALKSFVELQGADAAEDTETKLTRVALEAVAELQGVDTVTEAAKYVPVQYFGVMAGYDAPHYQDGTFIVKKENIVAIRKYVSQSLLQPVDLSAVEKLLGYTQINVDGLEPRDIQNLHQKIHQHALSWATLERDTKDLGTRLDLFAKGFINTGRLVIGHLEKFSGYKDLSGTIDTLSDAERAVLMAIPMGNSDTEKVQSLVRYLGRMKSDIEVFYTRITAVKALAVEFSRKISADLIPIVDAKLGNIEKAGIEEPKRLKNLRDQIKDLDQQIAEKVAEYDSLVGYAFTGLVFGPIGVAVTGGIFGSKAETVRGLKNTLNERRAELLKGMEGATLSTLLSGLAGQLSNIKSLMVDAEKGAKNLEDVWAILWVNVQESAIRLAQVDNAFDLNILVLDLQTVVEPWDVIQGHARALSKVFNEVVG